MEIPLEDLKREVMKCLLLYGYEPAERDLMCDVMLYAQMRDNNQGIVKLVGKGMPKAPDAGEIRTERSSRISALLDGQRNPGMVVLARAADMAVNMAADVGIAIVGTRGTSTSSGALGYYARRIALHGHLGLLFAGSPPAVCPYGSHEALFGTNPIAVGIPGGDEPLVIDLATAAITFYGLVEARNAGRPIPEGVAYGPSGEATTDASAAMEGATLPFDNGPKGSALSLLVEILTGPLVGASFAGIGDVWGNWGHLVIALDPTLFVDRGTFDDRIRQLRARIQSAKKLPGVSEVLLPGQRETELAAARTNAGAIEIEDGLWLALRDANERGDKQLQPHGP